MDKKIKVNSDGYVIPLIGTGFGGTQRMIVYLYQNAPTLLVNDGEDIASVLVPQWLHDAIVEATKKQLTLQRRIKT